MLVSLVSAPLAGKHTLAAHLVARHAFTRVSIEPSPRESLHFSSSSDFLAYATQHWRSHFVTTDLREKRQLDEFLKRPWVVVVQIQAPLRLRWRRAVHRAESNGLDGPTLDEFVDEDDRHLHGDPALESSHHESASSLSTPQKPKSQPLASAASPLPSPPRTATVAAHTLSPLCELQPLSTITLSNASTPAAFLALLSPANFFAPLEDALRPPWDTYFMLLASLASLRSNCMKRRVGAVLVRERRVVSTGYNGTPRGVSNCNEGGCGRCNAYGNGVMPDQLRFGDLKLEGEGREPRGMGEALDECLCLHAEENALLEAGRERVSGGGTEGAVLYCNTCPCLRCTVKIVQCGVKEVVYSLSYSMDVASRRVLEQAGVGLRQISMPPFPRS